MDESINYRALVYLNKSLKSTKIALWNAVERNAPERDIYALKNKTEVLDYLIGLAIKEDDED